MAKVTTRVSHCSESRTWRQLTHRGFPSSKHTASFRRYFEGIQVYVFYICIPDNKKASTLGKKLTVLLRHDNKYQNYLFSLF